MRAPRQRMHRAATAFLGLACAACSSPDPATVLRVSAVETHWAIDRARGDTQYIAPVVRFRVRNVGQEPLRSIQASATFRRVGEENVTWGSAFQYVASPRKPLQPGEEVSVVLQSDARYSSTGAPEGMFAHEQFRDTRVEFFLKVSASPPVKFGAEAVERRIGARAAVELAGVEASPPVPSHSPPAPAGSPR